jgi:hypothetical protein
VKHGRTNASKSGAVHALSTATGARGLATLCRTPHGPAGRWYRTDEPVNCRGCLERLESLAEQALRDQHATELLVTAAARADGERVRAFRRAWPAMGRAVADLLRHRGVPLGEGWLGPARESVAR